LLEKEIAKLEEEKKTLAAKMMEQIAFEELNTISARMTAITQLLEEKKCVGCKLSELV
jgi:hypothetical protein